MSSSAAPTGTARDELTLFCEGGASGAENMRRDSQLLQRCSAGEIPGAIRIYWFSPACLSLGRLQPLGDVDLDACARDGIDVVRRPSGGRAVLHENEVTYAVICPSDDPHFGGDVLASCARIHAAVALGLALLGVDTVAKAVGSDLRADLRRAAASPDCFATPAAHELTDCEGRKLVGSAQTRHGRALLQHGSVLLEPSRAHAYLRLQPAAAPIALRRLTSAGLRRQTVAEALAAGFRRVLDTTA